MFTLLNNLLPRPKPLKLVGCNHVKRWIEYSKSEIEDITAFKHATFFRFLRKSYVLKSSTKKRFILSKNC